MEEILINKIEWTAPEYKHERKSADFIWAIGLATIIFLSVAIWFRNYIFAIFIFISGISLIYFSVRDPEDVTFIIENDGFTMGKDKYEWENIKGFDIKKGGDSSILLIELNKYLLPVYTIPISDEIRTKIQEALLKTIPNIDLNESKSMKFVEKLGF